MFVNKACVLLHSCI